MGQVYADQAPDSYELVARRLKRNRHSISINLERCFWPILDGIAAREDVSTPRFLSQLHDEVLNLQGEMRNFASLLRSVCLVEVAQAELHARPKAGLWAVAPSYGFAAE